MPEAAAAPDRVPVRDMHRFDERALAAYLSANMPELEGPWTVQQFRGGQSNPTFHLQGPRAAYVLRKQPPGRLLRGAHAVDREFRVMQALGASAVPVPRMLHYCSDAAVIGTPFYLMEYVRGRTFRDVLLPGMTAAERGAVYDSMNATLAALHNVDWQAAGLADFGRPDGYFSRQVALWSRQYASTKTLEVPAMDRLMAWLPEHVPANADSAVVHGDYRLENLLFDAQEPRVVAVLDWELATIGHPLSDLAYLCMTYHLPSHSELARGFTGVDIARLGIPAEAEFVARYCARTGRGGIENWGFLMAFSLFRTAAIQQGVYARALRGNASSETAQQFGKLYPSVAELGWAVVENS